MSFVTVDNEASRRNGQSAASDLSAHPVAAASRDNRKLARERARAMHVHEQFRGCCLCANRAGRSRIERIVAQPRRKGPRRCAGVRSFLSHLITIMRPVIMTISMVIKKIAIRLVSARGNPSPAPILSLCTYTYERRTCARCVQPNASFFHALSFASFLGRLVRLPSTIALWLPLAAPLRGFAFN